MFSGRDPAEARTGAGVYNLANTLKTLGNADEAIRQYRQAIQIAPQYVDAH